ncbi:hypothetical protein KJ877_01475 [bacterium]|nr:hypothetical protein [bacterium]MBU1989933.1 hypothetical protein [bacterium]
MSGVHFLFEDFEQLVRLHIGMTDRLDENRAESFTLMYCDFSGIDTGLIDSSLQQVLRNSDSIANCEKNYFFVLPYTDKYGSGIVKKMFEDFFAKEIHSFSVSYPVDGETPKALLTDLQDNVSMQHDNDLKCLDSIVYREY